MDGMGLELRKILRFGPFRLNFTKRGLSSWSFKFWRWSWNSRRKEHRVDLPGPFFWRSKRSSSN
jgi:hypothetical protein